MIKVKHVIEGQNLVEIREMPNGNIEKEILAIGNPEKWAREYGFTIEKPEEEKPVEKKAAPKKRRGRKPKAKKAE